MAQLTIRLHPVDVLMFRETRWFGTSAGASESQFPPPRTIAGALRTYMMEACGKGYPGRDALREARQANPDDYMQTLKKKLKEACGADWPVDARIVGPFLGRDGIRYYPLPKTIVRTRGSNYQTAALQPRKTGADSTWLLACNLQAWEPPGEVWISQGMLTDYLGNPATGFSKDLLENGAKTKIMPAELRVGVGIGGDTGTAEEGLLYTSTFKRLARGWYLEADLFVDDGGGPQKLQTSVAQRPWLRLGGDAKVARVEIAEKPHTPPKAPTNGRVLVYLATPVLFSGGGVRNATLSAAVATVTGRPLAVSGWDLAANVPERSRYAVAAGAVYFLEENNAQTSVPHAQCISDSPDDCANGWGYCLRGAW